MLWFLLWVVLLAGAAAVFFVLGRRLWRQGKALAAEMTTASDRLAEVSSALNALAEATEAARDDRREPEPRRGPAGRPRT